jgi:SAM-dependent methyltransferase
MAELREHWDARYREADAAAARPTEVLLRHRHLLPRAGEALEIACGLGANARLLARHGLCTEAWDVSAQAIDKLAALAAHEGLPLVARVRDVLKAPPAPGTFDVIVVTRFLDRALFPPLIAALRPGGLVFYQTFTREAVSDAGPGNPDFRLKPNELLRAFAPLRLLAYREEGRVGDTSAGWRDEAMLVAMKPPSTQE